jgi:hypothetical protein
MSKEKIICRRGQPRKVVQEIVRRRAGSCTLASDGQKEKPERIMRLLSGPKVTEAMFTHWSNAPTKRHWIKSGTTID